MDYNDISPSFVTDLKMKLGQKIWEKYQSYKNVRLFLVSSVVEGGWNEPDSFQVIYQDEKENQVDVEKTVLFMSPYETVKMAIDLGIDTPGFLPAIPKFKNILKDENQSAYQNFDRAIKNVYENPDQAVSLASSTLEGIIKTILADDHFTEIKPKNPPLTKLVATIVKELGLNKTENCPLEIATIASQLRGLGQAIDDLRSDKSSSHGKRHDEYIIDDPLWASFIVNASATLGLFLWEFYEKKYKPVRNKEENVMAYDDSPIDLSEIPF